MAEFVNQRVEDMLSELEQMKRIELYTDDEIKEISKKRTDFEYKIHRQTRCKEDYLSYIAYECLLIQNIRLRRENTAIEDKKNEIEYNIAKRVGKIYKELLVRFPEDLEIWLNYIRFCKNVNFRQMVSANLERLLQIHGDKPKIWQLAGRWEYEEMSNMDGARSIILKGLHRHPRSSELYIDAFRLELLAAGCKNIKKKDEDKEEDDIVAEVNIERAKIIMESALNNISNVKFIIELCSCTNDFKIASSLSSALLTKLWDEYKEDTETWEFIALCELEGTTELEGFDWKSYDEDFRMTSCPPNLLNFCNVFETAVKQIDTADMCQSYINNGIRLSANETVEPVLKLQIVKRALMLGHGRAHLMEHQYKLWLELLSSDDDTSREDILHILETACKNLPSSEYLWEERLKRSMSTAESGIKIFKEARKALPKNKGATLWALIIENTRDIDELRKLYEGSLSLNAQVSSNLKPHFLKRFYEISDIDAARTEYKSMVRMPPFTKQLHQAMIEIEKSQKLPVLVHRRNCHELETQQFGKRDPQVWLDYIKFELESGSSERCGLLHKRACATLDKEHVDEFIAKYVLNPMK